MSLFVLDTDTLSLYRRGQPLVVQKMLQQSLNTLATTAITVEEQLTGWYTLLRKQKNREQPARACRNLIDTVSGLVWRSHTRWWLTAMEDENYDA